MENRRILRTAGLLLLILCILLHAADQMLVLKGVENRYYSAASTYGGFYHMRKNTVDVLLILTAHSARMNCTGAMASGVITLPVHSRAC